MFKNIKILSNFQPDITYIYFTEKKNLIDYI